MGQVIEYKLAKNRGIWGAREIGGKRKWKSLGTKDKAVAETKLRAEFGEALLPEENRKHSEMAKAHLNLVDPELTSRTWGELMDLWASQKHLKPVTIERRESEVSRGVFPVIRERQLCDQTVEAVIVEWRGSLGVMAKNALRGMQNLARDLGWILNPMIKPIHLKVHKHEKRETRSITVDEHEAVLGREMLAVEGQWPITYTKHSQEKHDFYLMLWLTGAAQIDAANLKRSNINKRTKKLEFNRRKTGEVCKIAIAGPLAELLEGLPKKGNLFPNIAQWSSNHRAAEFGRRLEKLGIQGVSLHSYRYAMAERCVAVGMPMRYAQVILGHSSKAVAIAYSKHADVAAPTPETYAPNGGKIINGSALVAA